MGHYTQIVWQETTHLGAALAEGSSGVFNWGGRHPPGWRLSAGKMMPDWLAVASGTDRLCVPQFQSARFHDWFSLLDQGNSIAVHTCIVGIWLWCRGGTGCPQSISVTCNGIHLVPGNLLRGDRYCTARMQ